MYMHAQQPRGNFATATTQQCFHALDYEVIGTRTIFQQEITCSLLQEETFQLFGWGSGVGGLQMQKQDLSAQLEPQDFSGFLLNMIVKQVMEREWLRTR